jgi:3-hydroxyisobutyrate dehydrogenase-like beta-hydroxyacid dehydrogenase
MTPYSLGLIGLGLVGSALAERLVRARIRVLGFDIDPTCQPTDVRLAPVREIAECEWIVFSLPTTDIVEQVVAEMADVLRAGQILVDTTTGEPERTAALGAALEARGVHYLDATIAGSSDQVRQGDVTLMIGGAAAAVAACEDLFACFARQWFHVGPHGSGARMKLVVNLVLGLNRAALAEGLALAKRSGLDSQDTLSVLQAGAAYSRVMDTKGCKMIDGDFTPQARVSQHLKDVRLILAEAHRAGARVPLSELHEALLAQLEAIGLGGADNAAIIRAFD